MTTILACGEGPHDIGMVEWSPQIEDHVQYDGWVQPILRKVFGVDIIIKTKRLSELVLFPNPRLNGLHGHGRRAALSKFIAKIEGCDRVVFVTDADTNVTADAQAKLTSIWSGFAAVANGIAATGCVPQSTSESWLLADPSAWSQITAGGLDHLPEGSPESLWGQTSDPASNHPKQVFTRACEAAGVSASRETRVDLANASDLHVLSARCPESVIVFLDDCQSAPH